MAENSKHLMDINDLYENDYLVLTEARFDDTVKVTTLLKDESGEIVKGVDICEIAPRSHD